MDVREVLTGFFDRIPPLVKGAVDGLDRSQLAWRPTATANSIGWLVWHLTRVEDHHLADLLDDGQVWASGNWADHFGLPPDPANTGYGHHAEDVEAVRPDGPGVVIAYHDAVAARTHEFLAGVMADDLERVVDRSFDPPVTLGVRLTSVAVDALEHAGQAAYVRGLLDQQ